jgi:hypothetical protein
MTKQTKNMEKRRGKRDAKGTTRGEYPFDIFIRRWDSEKRNTALILDSFVSETHSTSELFISFFILPFYFIISSRTQEQIIISPPPVTIVTYEQ